MKSAGRKPMLTKVVRITTGEVMEALVTDGGSVWRRERLKKDGGVPYNRGNDGWMIHDSSSSLYNDMWSHYSAEREVEADSIRAQLKALRDQVEEMKQKLLALYKENLNAQTKEEDDGKAGA